MRRPDAILLAGPTASGKSALAMKLAERFGGSVVNADSMQVFGTLRAVTARPSEADEARVPHKLYGHVPAIGSTSTASYLDDVRSILPKLRADGRIPIFTGGTGLYFQALEEGLAPVPAIDPFVRTIVRAMPAEALYSAVATEDPMSAKLLRPSDTQRLARALEVVRSTGRSLPEWQECETHGPLAGMRLRRVALMPDRDVLHIRIAERAEAIVRDPAARREVKELNRLDPSGSGQAAKAIGVAQISELLSGNIDAEEAVRSLTVATRRYAKRQYTWFNNSLRGAWERYRTFPDCDDR